MKQWGFIHILLQRILKKKTELIQDDVAHEMGHHLHAILMKDKKRSASHSMGELVAEVGSMIFLQARNDLDHYRKMCGERYNTGVNPEFIFEKQCTYIACEVATKQPDLLTILAEIETNRILDEWREEDNELKRKIAGFIEGKSRIRYYSKKNKSPMGVPA